MSSKAPLISTELIEYLEQVFKDKAPDLDTPDREVWHQVGTVHVVRHLKHLYAQQSKNILNV